MSKTQEKVNVSKKVRSRRKTKLPKNYGIFILNNDVTPFEVVEQVLIEVFAKPSGEAKQIMYFTHLTGKGLVVAPIAKEVAKIKIKEAAELCRKIDQNLIIGNAEALTFVIEEIL